MIIEAAWLSRNYPRALALLLSSFSARLFELAPLDEADLSGIATILARYKEPGIQLADASLVHLANREGIETIFTLDRRDFGILRLARGKKFHLIPLTLHAWQSTVFAPHSSGLLLHRCKDSVIPSLRLQLLPTTETLVTMSRFS